MAYSVAMKKQMQKRLDEMFNECIDEMDAIDIPYGKITEVTVNYRAKSRWGQPLSMRFFTLARTACATQASGRGWQILSMTATATT